MPSTKTLRVTLQDIVGATGGSGSTATVFARYVDTDGRGRDVHLDDGTIVVPVRRTVTPDADPEWWDFTVIPSDDADVREEDQGFLVEVAWVVTAPEGGKTSGAERVLVPSTADAIVQLGSLYTPTAIPAVTAQRIISGGTAAIPLYDVRLRHDDSAGWAAEDPVLSLAEEGIDIDTGTRKVGDGILAWSVLPASGGGGGGGTSVHGDLTGRSVAGQHPIGAITDLQATLDAKSGTSHTHTGTYAPALGADDNYVTDAEKTALHTHPAVIAQGATQADARTAIGAGTSSLVVGTGAGDAKAGNYQPAAANISDSTATGRAVLTATDAAAARTAIGAGTSSFSGAYADLTGKPTLGDAAAKSTGTTAGTLAAGDDSRITGAAAKASNLSDLASASTARTNLGLGGSATLAVGTTASTVAAGDDSRIVGALQATTAQAINAQTGTSYTLVSGDAGKVVTLSNAAAITLNAPGSVFTTGQRVDVVVIGAGMATVVGTSGATANATPSLVSRAQWSAFTVLWTSATACIVIGDMA